MFLLSTVVANLDILFVFLRCIFRPTGVADIGERALQFLRCLRCYYNIEEQVVKALITDVNPSVFPCNLVDDIADMQ